MQTLMNYKDLAPQATAQSSSPFDWIVDATQQSNMSEFGHKLSPAIPSNKIIEQNKLLRIGEKLTNGIPANVIKDIQTIKGVGFEAPKSTSLTPDFTRQPQVNTLLFVDGEYRFQRNTGRSELSEQKYDYEKIVISKESDKPLTTRPGIQPQGAWREEPVALQRGGLDTRNTRH